MPPSSPRRSRPIGFVLLTALVPIALAVALGCSTHKSLDLPPAPLLDKPWANVGEATPAHDADADSVAGLSQLLAGQQPAQAPGRPLNVLVMSGGGKYGAFTAGALAGWTSTGTRPTFDVATGVSSGAITAVLAFLGPKYDRTLTRYFTTLERRDLFAWRPFRGPVFCGTGFMTSDPLEQILNREVNAEFIADLRAAHCEGRRLYVATGNVLSNRSVVWDLGAIACSGRPDADVLLRKILLASCCIPGMVPPVELTVEVNGVKYTEWHADAGNIIQSFVRTPAGLPTGSAVWVLSAGKVYRDPVPERPRILKLVGGAVSNSLYALFRADAMKVYAYCALTRSRFGIMVLPQDFKGKTSSVDFDPEELTRMYWVGYQMAVAGEWRATPPDTLPGEITPPRIGLQFTAP